MRLHTSALLPLILFAFACSDSAGLTTSGGDLANSPPAPINGSDGDAFAPPTPEGAGPAVTPPSNGSGVEEGAPPPAPVPEPGTLLLVGSGLAGLAVAGRRRRREKQQADVA